MQKLETMQCGNCGGQYQFDPKLQTIVCEQCKSSVVINKDVNYTRHHIAMTGAVAELKQSKKLVGHCTTCGAAFKGDGSNIASSCEYCGSNVIIEFSDGDVIPDGCIPFAFDRTEAKKHYHKGVKKCWFVPNSFKKDPIDDNIEAIYFPAFKFDFDTQSEYSGVLVEEDRDGHDTFRNIRGNFSSKDYDLTIECSDYLTQSTLKTLSPYNMQGLYSFRKEFVMGYTVEHFNRTLEEMRKWADNTVRECIKKKILQRYSYDRIREFKMSVNYFRSDYSYIILPAYKINYKFKNKEYNTFINGQTGKLGGSVPRSKWKIFGFVLGLIAAIGAIAYGIYQIVG